MCLLRIILIQTRTDSNEIDIFMFLNWGRKKTQYSDLRLNLNLQLLLYGLFASMQYNCKTKKQIPQNSPVFYSI